MQVGDEIRIFEITQNGSDLYNRKELQGLQRAELLNELYGNCGVDLITKDITGSKINYHFGIDQRKQAKHVATMRITKIK